MSKTKKGGSFLIEKTNYQDIFILQDLTEEQTMMVGMSRDFIDKEVIPHLERFEKKDYGFTKEIMTKIGELGLLGVSIKEEFGGLGLSFLDSILVCDYLSGASGSLSTAYGAHTGIGTLPISMFGNQQTKEYYLPKLTTGEWFGAYCLTEPTAGSDANAGKTTATLSEDGENYSISGQKIWISNAGFAKAFTVFARIGDDKNITGFVVEYDENNPNGITFGEEEPKLGIRASSTKQVFFDNTIIPKNQMLGERNGGFKIALNVLNVGRVKLAVACLDPQRRIISRAVKYANERNQFGVPISSFGAIQKKLADMSTYAFVSESSCYRTSSDINNMIEELLESGVSKEDAQLKAVEEFVIESSILKVYASEKMQDCADEGIQIYGGMGFSEETPMEAAWRDARITRIYEGTNEINRLLTIGMLTKKAFKGQLDIISPAKEVGKELMAMPSFSSPEFENPLDEELYRIENLKKVFLMIAGKAVETFGVKLKEEQQIILNLSNILIEIYTAESAILATQKVILNNHLDAETKEKMAKLNLYFATTNIKKEGEEAILSFAEGDEQRILLMGLKRFTKGLSYPISKLRKDIAKVVIEENRYGF